MNTSLIIANRHTFFGPGSLRELLPVLQSEAVPTLLFCGQSFLQSAAWRSLEAELSPLLAGTEIVRHEASPDEIDVWADRWRNKVARVVAIGGGSVLDAAKAFATMSQHPLPTLRYLEKVGDTAVTGKTLPLIAVPTTAGTGSEVTQNAVVTDKKAIQVKASLRHANYVPDVAILDPDLLKGAPDNLLACCAIDAFTHLFEAYLSSKGNLFTRQTALSGLRAFVHAWPNLNRSDEAGDDARQQMLLASWLGGLSLSMAGLGVIHGIAGELGAIRDFHHGEVCGRLLLPFLTLLADEENAQQQALMSALADELFPGFTVPPSRLLAAWLKDNAIARFWEAPPSLSEEEVRWVLARSNSKNSLVTYSEAQQRFMIEEAYQVA